MDENPGPDLVVEYQVNVDLWKHDDDLRQQRNHTFLTMNTVLLVALGSLITLGDTLGDKALMAILISIFGLPVCYIWNRVQARNGEYIRFRRYQLRSIEARLPGFSTFGNQHLAMDLHKQIGFEGIAEKFEISKSGAGSSTRLEGFLPGVIAGFWLLILLGGLMIILSGWSGFYSVIIAGRTAWILYG
ncbi:MAG: hypothetical protein A2W35_13505 [Chloroflexi bacterium RBG_16_57_11]|nr:MAG: hypothetical protein A2W35_13505 [Chloroflexi bacterium RBG_16_57_11]